DGLQLLFQHRIAMHNVARFYGRGLAFNMGKDGRNLGNLAAYFGFQAADNIMRLLEVERFIKFQMQFYMKISTEVLHAHIMHIKIIAGRCGADAVKNALAAGFPRDRVNNHIAIRQNSVHSSRNLYHHLLRALERNIAGQTHRQIRKIAISGATYSYALNLDNPIDLQDGIDDLAAKPSGSSIEQRINGLPR